MFGPSGTGKTTLLRILALLRAPTTGTVAHTDAAGTVHDLDRVDPVAHRRRVALLSQTPVMRTGTVRDALLTGHRMRGVATPSEADLRAVLDDLGFGDVGSEGCDPGDGGSRDGDSTDLLGRDVTRISGGQAQRVALGRVLLLRPEVVLLDEPTSALDATTARTVMPRVLARIRARGASAVLVSHDEALATPHVDHVIRLGRDGRVQVDEEDR